MSQTEVITATQVTVELEASHQIEQEEDEGERLWAEHKLLRQSSGEVEKEYWRLSRERERLRQELDENRRKLYNYCEHNWVREPPMYQERTWYCCSKCGNMK